MALVPIAIVLLYFLKLRRNPLEVPSTYLWKRTVEDMHVNSLWQRLRNNLLLFLQLLLILFLIATVLRPGCPGTELEGNRFILVVDNSASMAATDRDPSRLEMAKNKAREVIENMQPNDVAMLIACSDQASIVQSYTSDKEALKSRLRQIKPTNRRSDISQALTAAAALANPGRTADRESESDVQVAEPNPAELYIFSDGRVQRIQQFSLGYLTPKYVQIGSPQPVNYAIIDFSLSVERVTEQKCNAFARIANFSSTDASLELLLYVNDELVDARTNVEVRSNDFQSLVFDLTDVLRDALTATTVRLEIETKDDLAADNIAYAIYRAPRPLDVLLVTTGNPQLESVLETGNLDKATNLTIESPQHLKSRQYEIAATQGQYDLIVFDRCEPPIAPESNCIFVGQIPAFDGWKKSELLAPVTIIDSAQVHPLMNNVLMNNVLVAEAYSLEGPYGTASLCDAAFGSVIAIGPRNEFEDVVVGFSIVDEDDTGTVFQNTDWPKHTAFPLFWKNAIDYFAKRISGSVVTGRQPGDQISLYLPQSVEQAIVTTPDSTEIPIQKQKSSQTVFARTEQLGVYQVADDDELTLQKFAINLTDSNESNLEVVEKLQIGHEEFTGTSNEIEVRKEYWQWFVIGAIIVLLIEWIVYNRRVFI